MLVHRYVRGCEQYEQLRHVNCTSRIMTTKQNGTHELTELALPQSNPKVHLYAFYFEVQCFNRDYKKRGG